MKKELQFLDISHKVKRSVKTTFKTTNYIKSAAKLLNGTCYHPAHVFRGIILSEATRLKN